MNNFQKTHRYKSNVIKVLCLFFYSLPSDLILNRSLFPWADDDNKTKIEANKLTNNDVLQ